MWYVSPEENIERVRIVATTESGCIAETFDGFAVNIEDSQEKPGAHVTVMVDQKAKE